MGADECCGCAARPRGDGEPPTTTEARRGSRQGAGHTATRVLGTWLVVLTVLELRRRLLQHTYLDYSIANFLAAVLIAFTFS